MVARGEDCGDRKAGKALGPVQHIVSPNKLHYLFLADWHAAFPDAKLWGTAATIAKCDDLHFGSALDDESPVPWRGEIDQFYFSNSPFMSELIFFHRASRTAIIADLSQTFSDAFLARHWPLWLRLIARLSKMTKGWGYPPIDYRISFRQRASAHLRRPRRQRPRVRGPRADGRARAAARGPISLLPGVRAAAQRRPPSSFPTEPGTPAVTKLMAGRSTEWP